MAFYPAKTSAVQIAFFQSRTGNFAFPGFINGFADVRYQWRYPE